MRLAVSLSLLAALALAGSPVAAQVPPGPRASTLAPARPIDPDPWLGRDKALHFAASAALAGGGYGLGALMTDPVPARLGLGAALALGAGLTKEALDLAGLGTPSWRDLAWDVVGTAAGLGFAVTVDFALRPGRF